MDDGDDKVIHKKADLDIHKQVTQTTKVLAGIEDKVINADYS